MPFNFEIYFRDLTESPFAYIISGMFLGWVVHTVRQSTAAPNRDAPPESYRRNPAHRCGST